MRKSTKNTQDKTTPHVWAMRHGPTTWNVEKRIQGNVETDIRPDKIEEYLTSINAASIPQPDIIFISELKRTEQTAKALQQYNHWQDIPLYKDKRLNERKWGIFEGMLIAEAREKFENDPSIRKQFPNVKDWDEPDFKVEGGESIAEVGARAIPAVREVFATYKDKKILFILHAGVLVSLGLDFTKISRDIFLP
jgi:broad specificity phosphatase PhoE